MIIKFEIPDLSGLDRPFLTFWAKILFTSHIATKQSTIAVVNTFMRLVDSCLTEYQAAAECIKAYYKSSTDVKLSRVNRAVTHFENCVSNMQRAIRCFNKFRNDRALDQGVRDRLRAHQHTFHLGSTEHKLGLVRNMVHHLDTAAVKGEITPGQSFSLQPTGPEVPVPEETGQTLKTIDRLEIGPHTILMSDLAGWLTQMTECAKIISEFRTSDPPSVLNALVPLN